MIIGLTGGIGSGKSTVAKLFSVMGALIFNSDEVAKDAYFVPAVKQKITNLLGATAYLSDNKLDKAYIAQKIFNSPELLQSVNAIIHPEVTAQMKEFEKFHHHKLIVKESALLFEAGLAHTVDKIIVVTAPDELRIERCIKRDNLSRDAVLLRMSKQFTQSETTKLAHFVVVNDDQQAIIPQVEIIMHQLIN